MRHFESDKEYRRFLSLNRGMGEAVALLGTKVARLEQSKRRLWQMLTSLSGDVSRQRTAINFLMHPRRGGK